MSTQRQRKLSCDNPFPCQSQFFGDVMVTLFASLDCLNPPNLHFVMWHCSICSCPGQNSTHEQCGLFDANCKMQIFTKLSWLPTASALDADQYRCLELFEFQVQVWHKHLNDFICTFWDMKLPIQSVRNVWMVEENIGISSLSRIA